MQVKEQAGFRGEYQIETIDTVTLARSDRPAAATQTKLVNERFRKQITTKERPTGQNYVESIVSLGSPDANFTIKEIGVFAGSTATGTKDSGKMISRIVVNIEKFENKIINIIRRDFITI